MWCTGLVGMWDLPGPGLEPASPALAGGFLTTAPPGKPHPLLSNHKNIPMRWKSKLFTLSAKPYVIWPLDTSPFIYYSVQAGFSSNIPGLFLSRALCTFYSLCLECSVPSSFHSWSQLKCHLLREVAFVCHYLKLSRSFICILVSFSH